MMKRTASIRTRRRGVLGAALVLALAIPVGAASAQPADDGDTTLRDVRRATARFHSVTQAERAGYELFLVCIDSDAGGMGQHYVNFGLLDGNVDALHPEAMVYEVTDAGLALVGVEYVVPGDLVDPEDPPELFGQEFHLNADLGVWVLHAWVWTRNPSGVFADFNPSVGPCP